MCRKGEGRSSVGQKEKFNCDTSLVQTPCGVLNIYHPSELTLIGLKWLRLYIMLLLGTECRLPQEECSFGHCGCLQLGHTLMDKGLQVIPRKNLVMHLFRIKISAN